MCLCLKALMRRKGTQAAVPLRHVNMMRYYVYIIKNKLKIHTASGVTHFLSQFGTWSLDRAKSIIGRYV